MAELVDIPDNQLLRQKNRVVAMHNVPEENIYRPHCWGAFGTADPENVDYRACAAYGPLYR